MNQIAKLKATLHRRSKSDSSASKIIFQPDESHLEWDEDQMNDEEVFSYLNSLTARQSEPQTTLSTKQTRLQKLGKDIAITNEDWGKFKNDAKYCREVFKNSIPFSRSTASGQEDPHTTENPKFKLCGPDPDEKATIHAYENHFADSFIKAHSDVFDNDSEPQTKNGCLDPFGHVPFNQELIFSQNSGDLVQKRNSSWTTFENNEDDESASRNISTDNSGKSTPKLKLGERGIMGQMRQSFRRKSPRRRSSKYETLNNEAAFYANGGEAFHSMPSSPTNKRWSIKRN